MMDGTQIAEQQARFLLRKLAVLLPERRVDDLEHQAHLQAAGFVENVGWFFMRGRKEFPVHQDPPSGIPFGCSSSDEFREHYNEKMAPLLPARPDLVYMYVGMTQLAEQVFPPRHYVWLHRVLRGYGVVFCFQCFFPTPFYGFLHSSSYRFYKTFGGGNAPAPSPPLPLEEMKAKTVASLPEGVVQGLNIAKNFVEGAVGGGTSLGATSSGDSPKRSSGFFGSGLVLTAFVGCAAAGAYYYYYHVHATDKGNPLRRRGPREGGGGDQQLELYRPVPPPRVGR